MMKKTVIDRKKRIEEYRKNKIKDEREIRKLLDYCVYCNIELANKPDIFCSNCRINFQLALMELPTKLHPECLKLKLNA